MKTREFKPEKVAPKLRRYALAKMWDEIIAEAKAEQVPGG